MKIAIGKKDENNWLVLNDYMPRGIDREYFVFQVPANDLQDAVKVAKERRLIFLEGGYEPTEETYE